jgi:dTDP-4-amino-4,6-dideoxygalactose transaminase
MEWKVQLCELNYDEKEANAVNLVLRNEWLTMGEQTYEFEAEFTKLIQHENQGIFVSSATAGLHLILMALGIQKNDEVIIPGLTFVSDANVVAQLGAKPVFTDSTSLDNFNVSVDHIVSKITSNTKAIVIVHFAGFPMDLYDLKAVCAQRGIALIEDCAHAPGASIKGEMCGSIADFSFFSFFSNKNLAVGEGGMVFAKDPHYERKIRLMRSHGMSSVTLQRHLGRSISYDVECVGLNYRPDEIRAAIGRVQLKKLAAGNKARELIYQLYVSELQASNIKIAFTNVDSDITPAYHILPVILPEKIDRAAVISKLKDNGIQTSIHYPNFKDFRAYKSYVSPTDLPIVNQICDRELTLPLHPRMHKNDVKQVTDSLKDAIFYV